METHSHRKCEEESDRNITHAFKLSTAFNLFIFSGCKAYACPMLIDHNLLHQCVYAYCEVVASTTPGTIPTESIYWFYLFNIQFLYSFQVFLLIHEKKKIIPGMCLSVCHCTMFILLFEFYEFYLFSICLPI